MPKEIKIVITLLILSSIFPFLGSYLDNLEFQDHDAFQYLLYSVDVFWFCIVLWIVWGIKNQTNHRFTVIAVSFVMLAFIIWDYFDYGFSISQFAYVAEFIIFLLCWYLLGKDICRNWCIK